METYDLPPKLMTMELASADVNHYYPAKSIKVLHGNNNTAVMALRRIAYFVHGNHFSAQVITKDNEVWYNDGMVNNGRSTLEGKLVDFSVEELSTCLDRKKTSRSTRPIRFIIRFTVGFIRLSFVRIYLAAPSLIPPVARTRKSSRFCRSRPRVAFIQSRRRLYFAVALAAGSIPRRAYTNLSLVSLFPLLSLRPITHPSRRRNNPSYSPRRCPSSAAAIDPGPPASPRVELVYLGDENRADERGSAHKPKEDSEEDFQTAEIKEEDLERTRSIEAHFGSSIAMKEDPSQHLLI
ncbi:hypothetical protein C8J56DRAFT_1173819 [Mycena floridula]|nr:hypothetical protein C8J56DRAFT_1173819 [Mycena floridula]